MADTIREKILADIKTALQAVTVANGFNQDLKTVERDRLSPLEIETFPGALIMDLGETVERQGAQVERVDLSVMVELWIAQEIGGAAAINQLIGDVKKKWWRTPGVQQMPWIPYGKGLSQSTH